MPVKNVQASHLPKGEGRRLRRARNIVRRYSELQHPGDKMKRRYERSVALLAYKDLVGKPTAPSGET